MALASCSKVSKRMVDPLFAYKSRATHFTKTFDSVVPHRVSTVIGDLSGTFCHPFASVVSEAFVRVFSNEGVGLHWDEVFKHMGMPKNLHIEALLENPVIWKRWTQTKGYEPTQDDTDRLYGAFLPIQEDLLKKFSHPLPDVRETMRTLQDDYEIEVGATTGFPQQLASIVQNSLVPQGVELKHVVGCDSVLDGIRPAPFMLYRCMELFDSWPLSTVVKVGDTIGDIQEGRAAGVWTVGVTEYSSMLGVGYFQEESIDLSSPPHSSHNTCRTSIGCQTSNV